MEFIKIIGDETSVVHNIKIPEHTTVEFEGMRNISRITSESDIKATKCSLTDIHMEGAELHLDRSAGEELSLHDAKLSLNNSKVTHSSLPADLDIDDNSEVVHSIIGGHPVI
jgi:hypothetical protein